jgi:hypothetical protein
MAQIAITPKIGNMIAKQVAFHAEYMTDFLRFQDYGLVKLYDASTKTLVNPPDLLRRSNDFIAAAYMHALAINSASGDDCVDSQGNTYELKLAYIKSSDMSIGKRGALLQGTKSGPESNVSAKWSVYPGSSPEKYKKTTALILMSYDHNCYITGFMLDGQTVCDQLFNTNQNGTQRTISLSNFIKSGYEFGSSIPHIGWNEYRNALFDYVRVKEQPTSQEETDQAVAKWTNLADPKNLKKL